MNSKSRLLNDAIITLVIVLLITSCKGMAGEPVMKVWLDQPLDGSTYSGGETIPIVSNARDVNGAGIKEMQYFINGNLLTTISTDVNYPIVMTSTDWRPDPGEYEVKVIAVNINNQTISAIAKVHVTGSNANGVQPQSISVTPTFTPTGTKKPITPTFTPTGTKKPITPTFTFTPKPPGSMNIWVDSDLIETGGCTVVHWTSTNVTDLSINGTTIGASGEYTDCPSESKSYVLRGQTSTGAIEKSAFVTVKAPPPTPPCPSGRTSSIAFISMPGGNCSSHPLGESFTLCFGLSLSGVESEFNYAFEDYTNASVSGDGNPSGTKSVLWTGTLSSISNQVCKNVQISGSTGLEAVKLVVWSSSYSTSDSDNPIVWIKVVP